MYARVSTYSGHMRLHDVRSHARCAGAAHSRRPHCVRCGPLRDVKQDAPSGARLRVRVGGGIEPGIVPIVPLIIGEPGAASALTEHAVRHRILAQAMRPPTVPEGTSRLRLVATAAHEEADLWAAAGMLAAPWVPA